MITYGSTTLTSYNTITKIEVYYYKSTSPTSLSGGSWSTTKPTWENGKYIWQKIRTTYEGKLENGQYYSESDPVNITGQQGQQGVAGTSAYSYKLTASDTIVTISKTGTYSTDKITFSATSKQGTDNVTAYSGRFKIETTSDGITWTTRYPISGTGVDESSTTFTIPANISNIRCSLYQTGGMTVLLDIISVSIVQDGTDGIDGTSENLLMDVYVPSLTRVKAPWNRYISNASNSTITGEFIEEANLPDPNATHFFRFTDSSATTHGRGLCFYTNGTPPFVNGHTYKIGCWVRKHAGEPKINILLGSMSGGFQKKSITNTDWEWIEWVRTFGETDSIIDTHNSTYKRLYFYFYNNNVEGSSLDICGFRLENVQTDISTARNLLFKTEKLTDWGITNETTIIDGIVTIPEVTANTIRGIYSTKNFDYELIRNQTAIFSVRVKAEADKICGCNLCIGLTSTEDSTTIQKYSNNYVCFTGTGNWQTICIATPINDEYFASGDGAVDYDNCWVAVKIESLGTYHNGFQIKQPQFSLGTTATAWSAAPEDIEANMQEKVDNIEIGGRNILLNSATNFPKIYKSSTLTTEKDIVVPEFKCTNGLRCYGKTGTDSSICLLINDNSHGLSVSSTRSVKDQQYVLSMYIKNNHETNPFFVDSTIPSISGTQSIQPGEAKRVIFYATGNDYHIIQMILKTNAAEDDYDITLWHPQIEFGNKVTDWSPAPEDVNENIQQVQDNLDNLEIGGRNLIIGTLNPDARSGGIYRPHLPGQIANTGGRGTCTVAEHGLRFTNTTANWEYIYFGSSANTAEPCMLGLEAGQTYTLSADLSWKILSSDTGKANTTTYGMGALLAYSSETNPNDFVTAVSDYPLPITQANKGTDMSGRLEFTFTVPSDAIRLYLGIRANNTTASHYAIGDYLEARNLKLEKGSKATDWTPAPEDIETEITSLEENLKSQIDEKIQTFYQATNPADSWNEDARSAHEGDLWYYTGDTTTTYTKDNVYRYNASNNTWTVYSASGELFDKVDGKTTIYYGTTSGTYTDVKIGDYLVDSTDGSSYRYDGSDWVKVTDYKTGIDAAQASADTAQASADTANDKIDNLEIGGRNLILDTAIERISSASADNSAYVMPAPMMSDYASGILNNRDDYFTYSFDYEVTGNEASNAYIYVQIRGGSVPSTSDGYYSYVLENPTGKYCCTFKLTEAQATGTYKGCGIRLKNATDGAIIRAWNIKLEKGTKATDWSPAPEDIDANIQQVQNNLDNLEIGGRNLLRTEPKKYVPTDYSAYEFTLTEPLEVNQTYTIHLWNVDVSHSAKTEDQLGISVYYCGGTVKFGTWQGTNYFVNGHADHLILTFTPTEDDISHSNVVNATTKFIRLYNSYPNTSGTRNMSIEKWKLEKGSKATDWSPAPEDTQSSINTALSQSIWYATCDTAGDVLIKEATITPAVDNFTLNVGTTVNVKFENANNGDRNSLKLNVNNTGDKDIRYMNNATMVAIPSNGYIIAGGTYLFVYDGTYWVIQNLNYNTNDNYYDRRQHKNNITAATAITAKHLIVGTSAGYKQIASTSGGSLEFDLGYPILWAYSAIKATETSTATYEAYPSVNFSTSGTIQDGAANKMLWLKGTITGTIFKLAPSNFLTTKIPNQNDDMYYIPLGIMSSATVGYFSSSNRIYAYVDDEFQPLDNAAILRAAEAKKTATNYMSSDNTGIMVADLKDGEQLPANATGGNVFITAGYGEGEAAVDMGVHIRDGQEDLAIFGESTRIGKENDSNVNIDNNGIIINKGLKELAKYSSKGIVFDEETPYKIGNDNSYIAFEDTDNDNKADSLSIVADSIYFRDTANTNIKDTLNDLQSDLAIAQEDIDLKNNYIKINTSEPSIVISASSNTNDTNLKLESSQLSFQIDGQTTATITNDQMNIPTASVTNLFMQSTNTSTNTVYEKVWVMRTNGHLSLKTITRN